MLKNHSRRWLTAGVTIIAGARAIDITIVTVALPQIMAGLGIGKEQITWIVTSYIAASAIIMPLTNLFTQGLGRKRLLLISGIGFTLASLFCGLATNFTQLLIARILQGAFGATLHPLAQVIMVDIYPKEKRSYAMSLYGIAVMVSPVFGPVLGGYLSEWFNWRWLFFINLPVCSLALLSIYLFLSETPTQRVSVNVLDFILLMLGAASLQIVLDQGPIKDWFESGFILLLSISALITLTWFTIRTLNAQKPILNLFLLKDPVFCLACILMLLFFLGLMGKCITLPLFLQGLLNFPVITTGLEIMPFGIASLIGTLLSAKLMKHVNTVYLLLGAVLLGIYSSYVMLKFSLSMDSEPILISNIVQGVSAGLFFTPLTTLVFNNIPKENLDEASTLLNFIRNIGTSIGVSLLSMLIIWKHAASRNHIISHIVPYYKPNKAWLIHYSEQITDQTQLTLLANKIQSQAQLNGFLNAYYFTLLCFSLMLPFIVLLWLRLQKNSP